MKLRSEKIAYADKPLCPKCGRRGIPFKDEKGFAQVGCSLCKWHGFWRFWFAVFSPYPRFEISFGPCGHCKYDGDKRRRWVGTVSLFGVSFIFNCRSFKDEENFAAELQPEPDALDADVLSI
jgi:hypothetical protein